MKHVFTFVLTAIAIFTVTTLKGQDSVRYFLSKIQEAYRTSASVRFSVKYIYSTEEAPQKVLDSAMGHYKVSGRRLWSMIDSTETIADENLVVVAFHREKKIYVDKPENQDPIASLASLDSFFLSKEIDQIRLIGSGQLFIQGREGAFYRTMTIDFDSQTFLIRRLSYLMYPTSEEETANPIVQIFFSNYDQSPFDKGVIAPNNYIERHKNAFAGVGRLKEYEVFIGSSKLLN